MIDAELQYLQALASDLRAANQPASATYVERILQERSDLLAACQPFVSNESVHYGDEKVVSLIVTAEQFAALEAAIAKAQPEPVKVRVAE